MELLIVIAITVILAGVAVPSYTFIQRSSSLTSSRTEIVQQVRLVQSRAQAGLYNADHGVYMDGSEYTAYVGDTYATRDTTYDRVFQLPGDATFTPTVDLNFAQTTGQPDAATDITLTDSSNGDTITMSVNSQGLIQ